MPLPFTEEKGFPVRMLLACPQCQTQYRLDPVLIGEHGRKVRCTSCGNIWLQPPLERASDELVIPAPPEMEVDFQEYQKPQQEEESFASLLQDMAPGIPEAVKPMPQGLQPAIMTHRPMGMGANVFGASVFLLLLFLTLGPLLLVREPLVRIWPAMALFYETIGIEVHAPGEGLRLSEMTAVQKVSGEDKSFVVQAKLTNVSSRTVAYPALEAIVEGPEIKLKTWRFDSAQGEIKPGEAVPLEIKLDDVPDEGKIARLRVTGP